MATKILNNRKFKELQPAHILWELYAPEKAPYRFSAKSISEAKRWQKETRPLLAEVLGFQTVDAVPLSPKKIEEIDKGEYIREKILIRPSRHSLMPVYILIPKKGKRPFPVVIAFHGHGYGVKDIVGLWEDGRERNTPDGYQKDFAVALCKCGFVVAAPEIACFGERQTDFSYLNTLLGQSAPSTCAHSGFLAFHLGSSILGLRVQEGRRLVDYLETRADVDTSRLGAMGISGGGMHTFYSTCLDGRIKACVVSGYYCTFRDSIMAMGHCVCNYVPGLHQFGEMYDLVGLIAPRPLMIEAGTRDGIFPIKAVKKSVARAKEIYKLFGAQKSLQTDYFEGRHQISGRKAYEFLKKSL